MRLFEIASAEEQIELWKLVSTSVWQSLQVLQKQQQEAAAQAAGTVGSANAYSGALGNLGNYAMLNAFMNRQNPVAPPGGYGNVTMNQPGNFGSRLPTTYGPDQPLFAAR